MGLGLAGLGKRSSPAVGYDATAPRRFSKSFLIRVTTGTGGHPSEVEMPDTTRRQRIRGSWVIGNSIRIAALVAVIAVALSVTWAPTLDVFAQVVEQPASDHEQPRIAASTSEQATIASAEISSDAGTYATYAANDVITVAVTFDQAVTVDTSGGTPYLGLRIGGDTRNAAYTGIDSTNTILTFSYTVVAEDSDQNGVSIARR